MYPVTHRPALGVSGFTLIETLIGLAILGMLLALGIPRMSNWLLVNKASGAAEFYAEGFKMARSQAVMHNSASRIVLSENDKSGQFDWRVDICFPTAAVPCSATSGAWSAVNAPAVNDPEGAIGYKSVFRSAELLPNTAVLAQTVTPTDASQIYFTSLGWIDTGFNQRLIRLDLTPVSAGAFPSSALVVTLAGTTSKCDPTVVAVNDSRSCP